MKSQRWTHSFWEKHTTYYNYSLQKLQKTEHSSPCSVEQPMKACGSFATLHLWKLRFSRFITLGEKKSELAGCPIRPTCRLVKGPPHPNIIFFFQLSNISFHTDAFKTIKCNFSSPTAKTHCSVIKCATNIVLQIQFLKYLITIFRIFGFFFIIQVFCAFKGIYSGDM